MSLLTKKVIIWGLEFEVDYDYDKGEPMVMYYKDMSGQPETPPSVEIQGVFVDGNEQDLYEVISDEVLEKIVEQILDSHE